MYISGSLNLPFFTHTHIHIPGISQIMPNPFSPAEHKPLSSKIILGCLSMFIIMNLFNSTND